MFLNLIASRRARGRALTDDSDSGFALITVIGIMAVTAIIAIAITGSAISAVSFTTSTRAGVQARSAADAGIDTSWVALSGGAFNCSASGATPTGAYTTTIAYFSETGASLACSGTVSGVPAKAVVNSKGVALNSGVAGGTSGNQRTITALFDIVVHPSSVSLDKAVFSESNITITNDLNVLTDPITHLPANLYSNGDVSCAASGPKIQGSILLQGNFDGPNNCEISGSVWAAGSVSVTSGLIVRGDLYSAGGTSLPAASVNVNTAFVGGTVVANGDVTISNTSNSQLCPLSGYNAKVCGSVVSIDSTITLENGAKVAGGLYAKGNVNLGSTNSDLIVGGNIVSTTGSLSASNFGSSGYRVGGYAALGAGSVLPVERVGNAASSCSTTFSAPCVPAQPAIPMSAIPAPLNFPTNNRVVAPPRESLPRIDMFPDAGLPGEWAGWSVQHVLCADVQTKIASGWTGKLLLVVDGCTAPLSWNGGEIVLPGDLAIMSPAGFSTSNNASIKSSVAGTKHTLMWIVPSDAQTAAGTALATWTAPVPSQPAYTKPTCAAGDYGDIRTDNLKIVDTETFIYTPCDLSFQNYLKGFVGQMYSGTTVLPNGSSALPLPNEKSLVMKAISVPGVTGAAGGAASVSATETARFDARDIP